MRERAPRASGTRRARGGAALRMTRGRARGGAARLSRSLALSPSSRFSVVCRYVLVLGAIQLYKIKCDGHSEPPQKPQLSRGELIEGILLWVHDREAAHGWVRALHTAVDG